MRRLFKAPAPQFGIQICPKHFSSLTGRIRPAGPAERQAFLRDRAFVPGLRTSTENEGVTHLDEAAEQLQWKARCRHGE